MRYLHDLQSLLYVLAYTALMSLQWIYGFSWWMYGLLLFFAISLQIIHHNHVHLGIWNSKTFNRLTCYLISVLTGIPSAMMLNGHIKNHHVHEHGPEDVTRTYRFGGDHNHALGYLLHPIQAFSVLIPLFCREFNEEWPKRTRFSRDLLFQCVLIGIVWILLLVVDWQKFLLFIIIPQAFGLHWLLGANYLQHAHCDDESSTNFARNFTGAINLLWFNIGFHTAHHEHPKAHWSSLPTLHQQQFGRVDPQLNNKSFVIYFCKTFLLGAFVPAFRSQSLRNPATSDSERLAAHELRNAA